MITQGTFWIADTLAEVAQATIVPGEIIYCKATGQSYQVNADASGSGGMGGDGAPAGPVSWDDIQNKPATFPPSIHTHDALYSAINHHHNATYALISHTHAGLPVMGRIAADISQSSNVTFSNLFTQAVLANEIWSFEADIYFTSAAATTGIVIQVDSPSVPTASQCSLFTQETANTGRWLAASANATMTGTAAVITPAINHARVTGTLENGANNGNLVVKFRSEVNNSAVVVKRGSWIRFFKH